MRHQRKVFGTVEFAHAAFVFSKGDVQDQCRLFSVPPVSHASQNAPRIISRARNVVTDGACALALDAAFRAHHDYGL